MKLLATAKQFSKHGLAYSLLLFVVFAMALHYIALAKISGKTVQRIPNEKPHAIIFPHQIPDFWNPWRVPDNRPGTYIYTMIVNYKKGQQTRYYAYPTGCIDDIQLNGQKISYNISNSCNRDLGFPVDLAPQLVEGKNILTIKLSNHRIFRGSRGWDASTYGLQFGPVLMPYNLQGLSYYICVGMIASISLSLMFFLRIFTGEFISGLIVSGGLLMYLRQLKYTSYMQYVIDMPSHFTYICYIANHGFPPKPMEGWEYYHPTLYYQLAAKVVLWCNWLGSLDALTAIRLFSIYCFMACIIFSTLILNRLIKNRFAYYPAVIMMVMYPGSIFYATRIDSHVLLYSFFAGCLYFLLRWLEHGRVWHLWLALICLGFAIAARSNALALLPLFGVAGLYQLYRRQFKFGQLLSFGMTISLCALAFGAYQNFGRSIYYQEVDRTNMPLVVGNIHGIDKRQRIQNNTEHLLFLNTQLLFNPPYLDWWHDNTGRQYFWNSVLKTSLFEHFWWHADLLAKRLIKLMLAAVAYIFISVCWMRMSKRLEWNMCSVSFFIIMTVLMINRVVHPYAPSQDFRYIYPILVSFCGLLGLVVEQHLVRHQYKSALLGIFLMLWFSYSSYGLIISG